MIGMCSNLGMGNPRIPILNMSRHYKFRRFFQCELSREEEGDPKNANSKCDSFVGLRPHWMSCACVFVPYHPCIVDYLHLSKTTQPNVDKYTIHGWYGCVCCPYFRSKHTVLPWKVHYTVYIFLARSWGMFFFFRIQSVWPVWDWNHMVGPERIGMNAVK